MKKFCWEVYNKSECETCPYFNSLKEDKTGSKLEAVKDIVLVEED